MIKTRRRRIWMLLVVMLTVVGAVAWAKHDQAPVVEAPARLVRTVRTTTPVRGDPRATVTLPGTARPSETITLVAKATGYIRGITVDIGDRVTAGQQLMTIEAAEVGEELVLARARWEEAAANVKLATATADRVARLSKSGAASEQERDDAEARLNTARAAVATGKADIERLRVLVGYQRIVAPFAGTVTRRLVDPGALAQSSVTALVELAATDQLDIEIDVPQTLAAGVRPGLEVEVRSANAIAKGTITRTAGALTPTTRTLRAEIRIPGSQILPNSYVNVTITSTRSLPPLVVPSNAVAATGNGTIVGVVKHGVVELRPVRVLRDLGKELEIEGDLDDSQIILNVPADLRAGETVTVAPRKETT